MTKSVVPLVLFILNIIPLFYFSSKGIESSNFYFLLLLMAPALLFLIWYFLGGKLGEIYPVIPIREKNFQSSQLFFLGVFIVVFLRLVGFVTSKVMSPFFLFSQKFYQAYVVGESRFMEFFTVAFSAGNGEEWLFCFLFVAAGMLVGYWLRKAWGLEFGKKGNYYFHITVGSLFSIIPFVIFHTLNPSYTTTSAFVLAGLFRFFMNILVWGVFYSLSFSIGFHIANNALTLSSSVLIGAFTSPLGLVLVLFFGTMFWNAIKHIDEADKTFGLGEVW